MSSPTRTFPGLAEEQTAAYQGAPAIGLLGAIAMAVRAAGVSDTDWNAFDRSLKDIHAARYDRIHKEPLFDDFDDEVAHS